MKKKHEYIASQMQIRQLDDLTYSDENTQQLLRMFPGVAGNDEERNISTWRLMEKLRPLARPRSIDTIAKTTLKKNSLIVRDDECNGKTSKLRSKRRNRMDEFEGDQWESRGWLRKTWMIEQRKWWDEYSHKGEPPEMTVK